MRWDKLFDDLESQLESEITAEELDVEAEGERLRLGQLSLRDRLSAVHTAAGGDDAVIRVVLSGDIRHRLRLLSVGRDWFSAEVLDDSAHRRQCVVPLTAVLALTLSPAQVEQSLRDDPARQGPGSLAARLGLPFVLRDLCRRRSGVDVALDGGLLHGTIDRVGRDHLDLAVHEPGVARRPSAVTELRLVPFGRICSVSF